MKWKFLYKRSRWVFGQILFHTVDTFTLQQARQTHTHTHFILSIQQIKLVK